MIRKLRTERDNQQWMLDLALNMRGRVQNFERDDIEVPAGKRARNYRMLPKVWREAAERHEEAALVDGVRLVQQSLRGALEKEGLSEIPTDGPFPGCAASLRLRPPTAIANSARAISTGRDAARRTKALSHASMNAR